MRISILYILLSLLMFMNAVGEEPVCKQTASYKMDVWLDVDKKTVSGKEVLTWENDSFFYVDKLQFHLYLNAFKNNRSTFMLESGLEFDEDTKSIEFGYCDILSMKILKTDFMEETDLTETLEFIQPDDNNLDDQTVVQASLPAAIPPHSQVQVVIEFVTKLPKALRRSGYIADYYFVAQWFPKIGVFWNGEWNCHQYHQNSEFFADYGTYDVNLTVPKEYIVGATGERKTMETRKTDVTTYNYYQECVHDFAWTACPRFIEKVEKYALPSGKDVEITLLLMPEHKRQEERYFTATKNAIKYYSKWYGEYPYTTVTVVDPAYKSNSGGMEYPTFFTGRANWLAPKNVWTPETVTVHEFGHGYWYGLIGSNEFENPWIDEGFNSFAESQVMQVAYGPNHYVKRYFGIPIVYDEIEFKQKFDGLSGYMEWAKADNMQRYAWKFLSIGSSRNSYWVNSYDKPQLMLLTLKNYLGDRIFDKIMMTFSQRWWYKHPKPQDFFDVVNEISGKDMKWFFDQFVYGSNVLDYAVSYVSSKEESEKIGIFTKWGRDYDRQKISLNTEKSDSLKQADSGTDRKIYINEVIVRRLGEAVMPVDIQVKFENGETINEYWDGNYRWIKYTYKKPVKVVSAVVDPEHKYVLDINYTNNSKVTETNYYAVLKWASKWMFWLQNLMETFAFFG